MSTNNKKPDNVEWLIEKNQLLFRYLENRKVQLESERFEMEARLDEVVGLIKRNSFSRKGYTQYSPELIEELKD